MNKKQSGYQTLALGALAPLSMTVVLSGLANTPAKWALALAAFLLGGGLYALLGRLLNSTGAVRWLQTGTGAGALLLRWLLAFYGLALAAGLLYGAALFWRAWAGGGQPLWLLLLLLAGPVLGCGLLGQRALLRAALLLVLLLPLLAIGDTLLLASQFQWANLRLPVVAGEWLPAVWLLAAVLAPLPLLPLLSTPGSGQGRRLTLGYGLAALYLLLTISRDTLVLGSLVSWDAFPLLRTLAMVKLGVGLERVEFWAILLLLSFSLLGAALWLRPLLSLLTAEKQELAPEPV